MTKGSNLVIVESPSKAKTIGKYLGPDYRVEACMGHLRDLPKSKMGVDLEHDFEPDYQPLASKAAIISELRSASKAAKHIYLATDPDREGEAISWHLKELLELPDDKTERVTFNEITKNVVTRSIQEPRGIDYNLVDAQQARRILDRIVGYQLSPLLWKKIRRGLSAGRVQSVATRLVVEREQEIERLRAEGILDDRRAAALPEQAGQLHGALLRRGKEARAAQRGRGRRGPARHAPGRNSPLRASSARKSSRSPTPPFITSTLQQEASRKLNMTPRRTMAVAQQLYEGVDISGEGTVGLITYMRTDSLRLSEEALAAARDFITDRYGPAYYPGQARHFRKKEGAQDAHEAIRPSNVRLDPESIQADLTREQYRLYKLIWSRFVACQMSDARYDAVQIDARCAGHAFRASDQILKFSGFTAVYEEGRDDEAEERSSSLPDLDGSERLTADKQEKAQHFTQPPARYTEATLVKAMEERGVGRPSTYASIVATIQDREYVIKKDKRLWPTPLGRVVTELMIERFRDIIDVEFTANMEHQLDEVEAGKVGWKTVLRDFYQDFHREMEDAEKALDGVRIKVPDEETDEVCELCGRKMVIKSGRFGRFLACPGFPECKNTKPLVERMPGRCPRCGSGMLKRKSKKGYVYYACERGAECGFMTWDVPTAQDCPSCGQTMFKKSGRGQMKPFCINEKCPDFLPEDKRGYKRRMPKATTDTVENAEEIAPAAEEAEKKPAKTAKTTKTGKTAKAAKAAKTAKTTKKAAEKKPAARKKTKTESEA